MSRTTQEPAIVGLFQSSGGKPRSSRSSALLTGRNMARVSMTETGSSDIRK